MAVCNFPIFLLHVRLWGFTPGIPTEGFLLMCWWVITPSPPWSWSQKGGAIDIHTYTSIINIFMYTYVVLLFASCGHTSPNARHVKCTIYKATLTQAARCTEPPVSKLYRCIDPPVSSYGWTSSAIGASPESYSASPVSTITRPRVLILRRRAN